MHFVKTSVAALALAGSVAAQASNQTLCQKYTTALFMNDTAANQEKLLATLVNTVVLGNSTANAKGLTVNGILNPGQYMGYGVNLAGFFNGGLQSSNRNDQPTIVNFLDGGGAAPLMAGMPANDTSSNQYKLLTHLYSYFGVLLGCDGVGQDGFPAYTGSNSQYSVHKYMSLDQYQVGYFISQVGAAASYFGVSDDDVKTVGASLVKVFNYKCSPPTEVIPGTGKDLQSICVAESCPVDPMGNCTETGYMNVTLPATANATLAGNSTNVTDSGGNNVESSISSATSTMMATGSGTATSTSSAKASSSAAAIALKIGESGLGLAMGAAAFAFAL